MLFFNKALDASVSSIPCGSPLLISYYFPACLGSNWTIKSYCKYCHCEFVFTI